MARFLGISVILGLVLFFYREQPFFLENTSPAEEIVKEEDVVPVASTTPVQLPPFTIEEHVATPDNVKAIYMTSWVLGTPSFRNKLVTLIKETELNAVVIDVKDNTGVISWEGRVKDADLESFMRELKRENIYTIARVAVFQDPLFASQHIDHALQKATGTPWKSKKGELWVDPGSRLMWDNVLTISKEAHRRGFDEINLDYIRYPTDASPLDLIYPQSGEDGKYHRQQVIRTFYETITGSLREAGIPVSGDLFGIITTSTKEIPTLGQDIHDALVTFDYVAPMIYPSHYAKGTFGYKDPNLFPKEVINKALTGAIAIADEVASSTGQATTTIRAKLRPWYQDFDMGAHYDASKVRAQIIAGEELGVMSWMMWDPGNTYTKAALTLEQ